MLNFTSLPKDKPNNNTVAEGRYNAIVFKSEMRKSQKDNSNEYLNVSFKIDNGGFVNENYFESDKPFLMYKLSRLLLACNVQLEGEGTLKDVAKVIQGKRVVLDVVVNDRGYGSLDYSGNKEGIYPIGYADTTDELDPEVSQAIEANVEYVTDDTDF
jgi:hypothetical protein